MTLRVERSDAVDADVLAAMLLDFGGRGVVEESDVLTTYLEPPDDPARVARLLRRRLEEATPSGFPVPEVSWEWQDQEDWAELWKEGLRSRKVTPRLVVAPSWDPVEPGPGERVLLLDPGMAFGTAEHATTRGCLRLIDPLVGEGDSLLDVGAGSGILSIAAVLLGADEALAVDSDPYACAAASENARRNGVSRRVRVEERRATSDWLASLEPRDGVVANIETGFLLPLIPGLGQAVVPGGWIVLSGILAEERDRVLEVTERCGLQLAGEDREAEWWSGAFTRVGRRARSVDG
jgi:ribosomal protein L11 methyltransferase